MTPENDILSGGLVPLDPERDPQSLVRRTAARIRVPTDVADDYLEVTGRIESGNRQYNRSGTPLLGPPTKQTGARAVGFGQVMPDQPGGTKRTIHGRTYDLTKEEDNVEAGLRLFSAGGPDPIGRRLEYFGGAPARRQYERTGQIPKGGDGYTSFQQYVQKSLPGPPQRQRQADILEGGLVQQESGPDTAGLPPAIAEMAALTSRAAPQPPGIETPAPMAGAPAGANVAAAEPPTAPSQTLSARDAAWHFGMTPDQAQQLTRRQIRVLRDAVAEDMRKKAAGETIAPPPLSYQNEMRQRAGLAPLQFNVPTREQAVAPYYQPEPGQLPNLQEETPLTVRPAPFRFNQDTTAAARRQQLLAAETRRRESELNSGVITAESRTTPGYFTKEAVERAVDEQMGREGDPNVEIARQQRVSQMGWPEYLVQGIKSPVVGFADAGAMSLKGVATLAKKLDFFGEYKGKDATDLATYQLGEALSQGARDLTRSDPGLEQEFWVGQAPQTIGQVASFMLGGWATKSPKLATVILGMGMTAGDAYDEVRANGGTDDDAVSAALLAGGLLGPTELIGMRGAMKALEGTAKAATWRAALKTALQEGRRDVIENALQEVGQEFGQGVITGNRRSLKELFTAGALGGIGGTATIPLTVITSRPQKEARPLEPAADVQERPDEGPIQLPVADRPIVAEKPTAIAAQMDALENRRGNRLAVMIPTGQSAPSKIPKGYRTTRTSEGVMIHPKEIDSDDVRDLVDAGETWRLLGHANPDAPTATRVVVARAGRDAASGIKAGDELMVSYVEPGQEQNVVDEMRQQFAPYQPYMEVGGEETAANVVAERSQPVAAEGTPPAAAVPEGPPGWRPGMPQRQPVPETVPEVPEAISGTAQPPAPEPNERFTGLSNRDIETYIANTRARAEKRLTRLEARPPKGTAKEIREARPRIIERGRRRTDERISAAEAELTQRRQGREGVPSFETWLETQAGGRAGGTRVETLSPEERGTMLARYDEQYYGRPHHAKFQNRRKRTGRFAPGKVSIPGKNITETITQPTQVTGEQQLPPAPWEAEAAPEGRLFAGSKTPAAREPTADEATALKEPVVQVKPLERQNALRSYLGNKITMARAGAFNIIPDSWKGKWKRVVDVFGGSGVHGWQMGKALGKPVHYNELDPDVYAFQKLASTNEGQEKLRRVWAPIVDEIARFRHQAPQGGTDVHRQVSEWWGEMTGKLRRPDASPEERAVRILLENTLGTMGNTQALMSVDHAWKKDIGALGDVSTLLDKHRLNAQMWESATNRKAEDLLPDTKPGELVVLDPPYASTKGYAVGGEHGSVSGAVNFIEQSVKPAVDRGVSIVYTNSAHLPIVEALRKAGMETRIERVKTQTATGQPAAFRYEVTAWTPDVSPPRGTDPEVLRGLLTESAGVAQQDLSGQTDADLWQTLIRTAERQDAVYAEMAAKPQRGSAEHARTALDYQRRTAVRDIVNVLAREEVPVLRGEAPSKESQIKRIVDRVNDTRTETIMRVENTAARDALLKEIPAYTRESLWPEVEKEMGQAAKMPEKKAAAPAVPTGPYAPSEGELVSWKDDGKTITGKVLKIMPSGAVKVRVSGRTAGERRVRLPASTVFEPATAVTKTSTRKRVAPRFDPSNDSLEKAARAHGGIKTDRDGGNAGEVAMLKSAGKSGLVNETSGMTAEQMAETLAQHGYGHGTWAAGKGGTGIDDREFLDALTEDAAGTRKHYSTQYEPDVTAEEEAHWRSQMTPEDIAQLEASEKFLGSMKVNRLLQEITDGQATDETQRQLRELGKVRGLNDDTVAEHIRIAEAQATETAPTRDRKVPDEALAEEAAAGIEGRPLATGEFIDEEGTLHSATGEPLFRRQMPTEPRFIDDTFFSQLYRAIEAKMPNRASVDQVRKIVESPQNGVKADEVKWTGFDEFLDERKGDTITKLEVQEFLRANALDIHEQRKTEDGTTAEGGLPDYTRGQFDQAMGEGRLIEQEPEEGEGWEDIRELDASQQEFTTDHDELPFTIQGSEDAGYFLTWETEDLGYFGKFDDAMDAAWIRYKNQVEEEKLQHGDTEAQYAQYVLPGPSLDYEEHVYTAPLETRPQEQKRKGEWRDVNARRAEIQDEMWAIEKRHGIDQRTTMMHEGELDRAAIKEKMGDDAQRYEELWREFRATRYTATAASMRPAFESGHWSEENVLAHSRTTRRVDVEGKKGTLVEEVQSDLHQEGRERGYQNEPPKELPEGLKFDRVTYADGTKGVHVINQQGAVIAHGGSETEALAAYGASRGWQYLEGPPPAPFAKNWHEFVMKRLLRKAAENGDDRLYWTTGKQQIDRWSEAIRQNVDYIAWEHRGTQDVEVKAAKEGNETFTAILPRHGKRYVDSARKEVSLDDVVGRKLAQQIREEPDGKAEGDDLAIGGEGMIQFYDRMLPSFMRRLGGKFGATVGKVDIGDKRVQGQGTVHTVHYIDITPAMRESVMAGQPLFKRRIEKLKEKGFIPIMRRQDTRGEPRTPRSSLFFGPYEISEHGPQYAGYRDYGPMLSTRVIDKSAKIFKAQSSYDFLSGQGIYNKPDPFVRQLTNGHFDTVEQVVDAGGDYPSDIDPDGTGSIMYVVSQRVAERELRKEGYDGAHWKYEDDLSPEQFQIWNRNVIKRVGEVLTKKEQRELFARRAAPTTAEGPPVTRDGSRLTINSETRDILERAGVFKPGTDGVTLRPGLAETYADRLRQVAKGRNTPADIAPTLKHVARQMQIAANLKDVSSVIVATPDAMKHERFHAASAAGARRLQWTEPPVIAEASLRDRHARLAELTRHPGFTSAKTKLIAAGYPKDLPTLVEEAAAHIAEGKYQDIGMTRRQAIDFLDKWFQSFSERNGDVSLEEFRRLANEGQQTIAAALEQRAAGAASRRPDEAVSGMAEGREEGAAGERAQTRTRAFRRWFGDSKVTDEQGRPLVVYHGTSDDLQAFDLDHPNRKDTGYLGDGIYLTNNPELAGSYSSLKAGAAAPNVMPLYASIKNPYYATMRERRTFATSREKARAFTDSLRTKGHDGIILKMSAADVGEANAGTWEVVAFDPKQVKSATGNRGTFDPNDPNILHKGPVADIAAEPRFLGGRFFSQLYRTLVQKMPGRASAEQIRKIVENPQSGVKADEIKWSGLDDFLAERKDATRAEVLDFLKANQLQIEEKGIGEGGNSQAINEAQQHVQWLRDMHSLRLEINDEQPDMIAFRDPETEDFLTSSEIGRYFGAEAEGHARTVEDAYATRGEVATTPMTADEAYEATIADQVTGLLVEELMEKFGLDFGVDPANSSVAVFTDEHGQKYRADQIRGFPDRAKALARRITDQHAQMVAQRPVQQANTKYAQYTVPGKAENYREMLFTLPREGAYRLNTSYITRNGRSHQLPEREFATREEAMRVMREEGYPSEPSEVWDSKTQFRSSHWQDTPNVLAHTRVDDRVTSDSKRALFVNEAQSDWHQKGRRNRTQEIARLIEDKRIREDRPVTDAEKVAIAKSVPENFGYKQGPAYDWHVTVFSKSLKKKIELAVNFPTEEAAQAWIDGADGQGFERIYSKSGDRLTIERGRERESSTANKVPPAPFQKNWHEFVMRRMLADAVEGGYDYLAWATGDQSNDLYDLSKHVDALKYKQRETGDGFMVWAMKDGKEVLRKDVPTNELEGLVGKEIAQKIIDGDGLKSPYTVGPARRGSSNYVVKTPIGTRWGHEAYETKAQAESQAKTLNQDRTGELSGLDLKVGGQGMRGFYDKMIPDYMRRLVKKWGGKVETLNIGESVTQAEGRATEPVDGPAAQRALTKVMEAAAEIDNFDLQEAAARMLGAMSEGKTYLEAIRAEERYGDRDLANRIVGEVAMAAAEERSQRSVHAIAITPQMRESLLADGQPLFRRQPKETDQQYEKRTKSALDRLREVAQKRGQNVREFIPRPPEARATPATPAAPATSRTTKMPSGAQTEQARAPAPLPPPKLHVPGERSFPKTAERAGFIGGTDRDYTVLTNQASLEAADRRIARLGQGRAAAELAQTEDPGAEETATGLLLMQRFEKAGQIDRAVAVANDLARKLTKAGQFVQAASIVSRLSPEGVLLSAQQRMKGGRELSPEVARIVVAQAREVEAAEKLVEDLRRMRPDVFGPNGEILPQPEAVIQRDSAAPPVTRRRARERIGKLQDRLATMEQEARARMELRAEQAKAEITSQKGQRGAGINPVAVAADLRDLVIIGASKLARSGIDQAVWIAEMAREATALTRKDLRRLYRESFEMYEAERKRFLAESRQRGAERQVRGEKGAIVGPPTPAELRQQGPLRPSDYRRIVNERLDAQTAARKARTTLARTFRDLNAGWVQKGLRRGRDVWNLSRSLITSVDFSGSARQGKMGLVTHPRSWLHGFARQFRALSTKQYERIMSEIETDPDYKYALRFKLHLAGFGGVKEEAFESDLVQYIPWIKHSEQAYNTMLNTLRMGWFKAQLEMARRAGLDPDDVDLKDQFIRDTALINSFTGRGGGRFVEQIAPVTNTLAFSTRFWASRLKVLSLPLDPRMYGIGRNAYSKPARVDAWRTLFGFYGLVGAQLYLAALAGATIGLDPDDWENFVFNPDSADFLKARFGKVHVDFSAGLQTHLRVAARLSMSLYKREYQKGKPRKAPTEITHDYLRAKLAPNPALIYDLFLSDKKMTESGPKGTDFAGQPVYLTGKPGEGKIGRIRTSALAQRFLPIVVQDAMEAYKEGISTPQFTGATLASVLGEGVTTYSKNYSERGEKWPMKAELERHGITVNPPQRIKPGKYDSFKAETDGEYQARRQREAESVKRELERLEGMSYYKKLSPQEQEKEIRAAIKAGREAARATEPAAQRQAAAAP